MIVASSTTAARKRGMEAPPHKPSAETLTHADDPKK
jgi:hypothetical protein